MIKLVLTSTRIAPLFSFLKYDQYVILYIMLILFISVFAILLVVALKINNYNSKFYQGTVYLTRVLCPIISIVLIIPITGTSFTT